MHVRARWWLRCGVGLIAGLVGFMATRAGLAEGPARPRTVDAVVGHYKAQVRGALEELLKGTSVAWPPHRLQLLAFKEERRLEVWVAGREGPFVHLSSYDVLAASGKAGPKRREGDFQVPEGFYGLPILNPNSRFHLSIRVDYPGKEDIAHTKVSKKEMGGDIYIHGSNVSIGCLAIGNAAISELFTLAAQIKPGRRQILIAPIDFRRQRSRVVAADAPWVQAMYQRMAVHLQMFPVPE